MDVIYSRAWCVQICMEDPSWDYWNEFQWLKNGPETEKPRERHEMGLKSLLSRRWFQRVWVIQEVALSNAAFLNVNDAQILLSHEVLKRLHRFCERQRLPIPGSLRWTPGMKERFNILECLNATRTCSATDPRDKVYAILSLVDCDFRRLIPIDYARSEGWLLTTVAIKAIEKYRSLSILDYIDPNTNSTSWIPTWQRSPVRTTPLVQFHERSNSPWREDVEVSIEAYDTFKAWKTVLSRSRQKSGEGKLNHSANINAGRLYGISDSASVRYGTFDWLHY